jgi:hypothetical protein
MDDLTRNEPLQDVLARSPGWSAAEPGVGVLKNFPPRLGGELKGEPLITVRGLQGVVDLRSRLPASVQR